MERSEAKTDKKEQERADAKLRQLQLVQLEILKKLDEICKRNDRGHSLCPVWSTHTGAHIPKEEPANHEERTLI